MLRLAARLPVTPSRLGRLGRGMCEQKKPLERTPQEAPRYESSLGMFKTILRPEWLLLQGVVIGAVVYYIYNKSLRDHAKQRYLSSESNNLAYGAPAIGGPFTMRDLDGKTVTQDDFKGKWMLIYFGFTNCPDICPDELHKMAAVIEKIEGLYGDGVLAPVFVSIDPVRDTAENVREYLLDFSPKIKGLIGSPEATLKMCRAWRVYYAVPDEPNFTEEDYLVDHSIITYLMDADGKFSDYFSKEMKVADCVSKTMAHLADAGVEPTQSLVRWKEKGKIHDVPNS